MLFSKLSVLAVAVSAGLAQGQNQTGDQGAQGQAQGGAAAGGDVLNAANIQSASGKTGQEPGTDGIKPGQAESQTDPDNFINFCTGKTITNGIQNTDGSCNGVVMGDIPAKAKMVSAVITNPQTGVDIQPNTDFDIALTVANLQTGTFVNPTTQYYTAPQALNGDGSIIGHVHVSLQDMGNTLNPTAPLDAQTFAFFKGIDDAGDGQGNLKTTVTGGLPAGIYRVCTLTAAANHQPVTMPVAQRGPQDDCTKFTVGGGGAGGAQVGAADPNAQGGAADPNAQGGAVDPNAQGGAADPNAQGGAVDPNAQGGAVDPNAQGGAADPNAQGGAADPNAQGGAADPNAQGGAADPNAQGGAADPNAQGGAADPNAAQGGAADPNAAQGGAADPNAAQGGAADPNAAQGGAQGGADPNSAQGGAAQGQQQGQQGQQQGQNGIQGSFDFNGQRKSFNLDLNKLRGAFRGRRARFEGPRRGNFQARPYTI